MTKEMREEIVSFFKYYTSTFDDEWQGKEEFIVDDYIGSKKVVWLTEDVKRKCAEMWREDSMPYYHPRVCAINLIRDEASKAGIKLGLSTAKHLIETQCLTK